MQQIINLRDLVILIANTNSFERKIVQSILRGFGANKSLEVDQTASLFEALDGQKVDILMCDGGMPPDGAFEITRTIRRQVGSQNRTMPILIMTSDTRETTVRSARDSGANMVLAKPLSPRILYDRLAWIAYKPRQFIDTETYFGPDRRFKIEGYPNGVGRRKEDRAVEVAEEAGPALAQDDIDNLFGSVRAGQEV